MKFAVIVNREKSDAVQAGRTLKEALAARSAKPVTMSDSLDTKESYDLVFSVGGDGTILRCVHDMGSDPAPILGINLGGLGFLTELTLQETLESLDQILKGNVNCDHRNLLSVSAGGLNGYALNEIVISPHGLIRLMEITLTLDNNFSTTYRSDGLIVATPTGSTAHSLSAGGPIVSPAAEVFIIAPICPHTLSNRPLVVNSGTVISMYASHDAAVSLDGQTVISLSAGEKICAEKAPFTVPLVRIRERSFYDLLIEKLKWSGMLEK